MAGKKIIWSKSAKQQLMQVLEFFAERNGNTKYSLNLLNEVEKLMFTISMNEQIGRLTSNKITRVIPMKEYCIFYETSKNDIKIVAFWDNRQNPKRNKLK